MQHTNPRPRLLVPIDDSCAALGNIGRTTLYELAKQKKLVKVNIGRRGFITAESLEAYVDRLAGAAMGGAA
jgi:Helix-turn-helix domain